MIEIIEEAIIDVLKLFPFLFLTYLIMEYIEHKMSQKSKQIVKKSGKWGPIIGGIVGVIPQCGFSASATNLYVARVISLGTLIAVYLSTSDEMIPIAISEAVPVITIFKIVTIKIFIGMICGLLIDFCIRIKRRDKQDEDKIEELCEHEHCHCESNGILKSSIKHTFNIIIYIFIINLIINMVVEFVGEDNIANFVGNHTVLGPVISSLIGLIPNCAASVIITDLYIQNIINGASLIAGLLTGAGVGLIILFKINKNLKENIKIVCLIYGVGVLSGLLLQALGIII